MPAKPGRPPQYGQYGGPDINRKLAGEKAAVARSYGVSEVSLPTIAGKTYSYLDGCLVVDGKTMEPRPR